MNKMLLAAVAATAMISSAAIAAVTFDPATGTGFVGKGDVQVAYGWNNAAMQSRHLAVTFVAAAKVSYDVTCEWETLTGGKTPKIITHEVTNKRKISSTAAVDATSRKTGQYTGWHLTGLDGSLTTAEVPSIGDPCPQGGSASDNDPPGNDAVVIAVDNIVSGAGTLSAVYNNDERVIHTF